MSRSDSLLALEAEIGVLVRRIRRVIVERTTLVHPEMQPSAYMLLAYVVRHGPTRASTLVGELSLDKGAISRQVAHLVELGLASRDADPDDGRAVLVSATERAVAQMAAVAEQRREWLDERLTDWNDERLAAFATELGRYNDELSDVATS